MARRSAAPTYQYEPLITPSEWTGEERNFSIRLTQILDNLHAKIGALSGKAPVREITAADLASKSTADRAALYANGARLLKVTNDDTIVVLSLAADGSTQFMSSNKPLTNLLDNSDFTNPVNQRGEASYSGNFIYCIDRWVIAEGASGSVSVLVEDGGITFTTANGGIVYLIQRVEKGFLDTSKDYTRVVYLNDGSFLITGYIDTTNDAYDAVNMTFPSGSKIKSAALYEGSYTADNLPPYVPKGYTAELAECRRYYTKFIAGYTLLYGTSGAYDGSDVRLVLPISVTMRIAPTVAGFTVNFITSSGAKTGITFTPDFLSVINGAISFYGSASSAISSSPTYTNVLAEIRNSDLELNADL